MGAPLASQESSDLPESDGPPAAAAQATPSDGLERIAPKRGPLAALGFAARHRMLTPKYARLLVRFLARRTLTIAGRRIETDGMLFIGPRMQLQIGKRAKVKLGRFVWIGHGTKIRCHEGEVEVGNNVWIGYNAQVLRGVRVGDNSIIGANSVVTRDIPANAVAAGTPARVIRMREAPEHLRWTDPVEPPGYGPAGPR